MDGADAPTAMRQRVLRLPRVPQLDWQQIAKSSMHPLQVRVLERALSGRIAPIELADQLDANLGDIAYHVRALHERGLLEKAGICRKGYTDSVRPPSSYTTKLK